MSHVWVKISNFRPTLETIREIILNHREKELNKIFEPLIGQTIKHGVIFKKVYKIETTEDAIAYILQTKNGFWHYYRTKKGWENSLDKIDELLNVFKYSDEEFAQISVKDISIITNILGLDEYSHLNIGIGRYA